MSLDIPQIAVITTIVVASIALLLIFIKLIYVQATTDEVVIITGPLRKKRTLVGRGGLVIPLFEKVSRLSLAMTPVDVKTSEPVPTLDYIDLMVDAVANVKIPNDHEMIDRAAENFLNCSTDYISNAVRDVLEGNTREIIGCIGLRDLINDRKAFIDKVTENAKPDLEKMGLEIVTFNVQNFRDSNGVIEALGVENTSAIKKSAQIARQEAEKEVMVNKADNDQKANEASVRAQTVIAERDNSLAVKKAELLKIENQKKAEAEAAYGISQEEQRKSFEEMNAAANAIKANRDIAIQKDILAAELNNKEDARLYAAQREADAVRAQAEANSAAIKLEAEAEAEKIRMIAKAEAERAREVGIAEAEALEKKAEAMKQYGEAAILETVMKAYVEMSANVVKPLENIDSITMYGDGNQTKLVEDTVRTITQLNGGLSDSLGVDIKQMIEGFIGNKAKKD